MSERFYGWRNKFTWLCALYLEKDENIYNDIRRYVKDMRTFTKNKSTLLYCLNDYIYSYVTEKILDDEKYNIFEKDLIQYAIEEIDFWEIAENFLEE